MRMVHRRHRSLIAPKYGSFRVAGWPRQPSITCKAPIDIVPTWSVQGQGHTSSRPWTQMSPELVAASVDLGLRSTSAEVARKCTNPYAESGSTRTHTESLMLVELGRSHGPNRGDSDGSWPDLMGHEPMSTISKHQSAFDRASPPISANCACSRARLNPSFCLFFQLRAYPPFLRGGNFCRKSSRALHA